MPTDTELHKAAHNGDLGKVKQLVEDGEIAVNEPGAAERRALHRWEQNCRLVRRRQRRSERNYSIQINLLSRNIYLYCITNNKLHRLTSRLHGSNTDRNTAVGSD